MIYPTTIPHEIQGQLQTRFGNGRPSRNRQRSRQVGRSIVEFAAYGSGIYEIREAFIFRSHWIRSCQLRRASENEIDITGNGA